MKGPTLSSRGVSSDMVIGTDPVDLGYFDAWADSLPLPPLPNTTRLLCESTPYSKDSNTMDFSIDEYFATDEDERNRRWPHTKLILDQDGKGSERLWVRLVGDDVAMLDNHPLDRRWYLYDIVRHDGHRVRELVKRNWDCHLGLMYHAAKDEKDDLVIREDIYNRAMALGKANVDVSFFRPGLCFIHVRCSPGKTVSMQDVVEVLRPVVQVFDISDLTTKSPDGQFEPKTLYSTRESGEGT